MKKIDGFVVRRLGKEAMVVAESVELVDFDKIVSLNSSAEYIWESLSGIDFNIEDIAALLTKRYDIDGHTARSDAEALVRTWIRAGIIKE